MTTQSTEPTAEDFKLVLGRCKALEAVLTEKFGAVGRGLHEKADSCIQRLPESTVKRLRFIASVRNKTMHEVGYVPPIQSYAQACDAAESELAALEITPPELSTPVSAPPAAMPNSATGRLPRIISYPLMLGVLFWLVSAVLGQRDEVAKAAQVQAIKRPPFEGAIPFAMPATTADKDAYAKGAALVQSNGAPLWSMNIPAAAEARFDWRSKQAAYDKSHAHLTTELPDETLWVVDTSAAGLGRMKEIRKRDSRVLQVDVLLGGKSGLRATLEVPMAKPPHGDELWLAYGYSGALKFSDGQEVFMPGVQFYSMNGAEQPDYVRMSEVFVCPKYDDSGCLGWTLNPKATAVALSRRGTEYAARTK